MRKHHHGEQPDRRAVHDIAVLSRTPLFQLTNRIRLAADVVIAAALLPHATPALVAAVATLVAGTGLGLIHDQPVLLAAVGRSRLPGTRRLHQHLTDAITTAGVDLPSAIEAIGITGVAVAVMTANPDLLPAGAAGVALAADAVVMIGFLVNVTIDPTLFDPAGVPRWIKISVMALPLAAAAGCAVIMFPLPAWLGVIGAGQAVAPGIRLLICVSLCLVPLLIGVGHRILLRVGAATVRAQEQTALDNAAGAIHHVIVGPIAQVQAIAFGDPVDTTELRRSAALLVAADHELKHLRHGGSAANGTVAKLADVAGGAFINLDPGSGERMLTHPSDYQMAKALLLDLTANTVRHGDGTLNVTVDQPTSSDGTTHWQWTLTDHGPGMTSDQMGPSLQHLRQELRALQGGLELDPTAPDGTTWVAWWPIGQAVSDSTADPDRRPPSRRTL